MLLLGTLRYLTILALLSSSTLAQKVGLRSKLGFGCFNCALKWNFDCPLEYLPFDCRCSRDDFLTTAMNCVQVHAAGMDQVVAGYDYIRAQCHYWGNRTMTIEDMEAIYKSNIGRLISPDEFNSTSAVASGPVAVPSMLFEKQLTAASDTKYHYHVGNCFGWGIIGYWGFIMAGAIVTNIIRIVNPDFYDVFGRSKIAWLRKTLTLPALVGSKHHSPWRFSRFVTIHAPTRGQAIIILGFLAINIASIVSFLEVVGETPLAFSSKQDRILHYMANRTGIIAFAHIPLIVLFACRNNPFIFLTGWPYDTFMTYHRWAARCMATQALIHAVMMYWSSFNEKVVLYKWRHVHNWRGGNLAIYMVIIMLTVALRAVRSRIYEIFKVSHVAMFIIFITCLIVHCSDYGWLGWLWASLAFYGAEYMSRLGRQILSGGIQEAEFTLTEAGMYRVKVKGGRRKWNINPGAYVYIRILDKSLFWQEHPFSIFQSPTSREDNSLDLCCKAQMGATRTMLQKVSTAPEKSKVCKVIIEGPYGNENYVCNYDSVLLFAGGVGFTAIFSFATRILERMQPGQYLSIIWVVKDCSTIQAFGKEVAFLLEKQIDKACDLRIYVTHPDTINLGTVEMSSSQETSTTVDSQDEVHERPLGGVLNEDTDALPGSESRVTINSSTSSPLDPSKKSERYEGSQVTDCETLGDGTQAQVDSCHIVIDGIVIKPEFGRPGISAEVSDFIKAAQGTKAICSCGPPRFVDAIRDGIITSVMASSSRVDYFEDAFSW